MVQWRGAASFFNLFAGFSIENSKYSKYRERSYLSSHMTVYDRLQKVDSCTLH